FVVFPMLAVANTVELHWYDNDTELRVPTTSQSCEYGGTFDVPTPTPRKGYVFTGWRVKQCSLSGLDPSIDGTDDPTHYRWKPISSSGYTMADAFGTENSSDLNNGEWALTFSYGTVKGKAKCSNTKGDWLTPGAPSDTSGQYCWCQATNYTPDGGNQCNIASPFWVFFNNYGTCDGNWCDCPFWCAGECSYNLVTNADFRGALFGVSN
ncbi:MAG: hypothetical protein ACLRFP_00315, partial [Alphaproteobacteria bacterium]